MKWINRKVWAGWLALVITTFGVLEAYALRTQRGTAHTPTPQTLDAQGLSEKAAFPTLSAYLWELTGIYPTRGRRYLTRPILGGLLLWFTVHILYMVPWPWEREVIDHVRKRTRRS